MNEGGILIANLTKGKIGATASHLLGASLATTIAQVAEERAAIPFEVRRDFTLYADEVQNFATESFAQTLSEARNWRLMCVLAHQHLSQLPRRLQDAIIANCGNYVVFRIGAQDADVMAAEPGIENGRTLADTSNFSAWVKLLVGGNPTEASYLDTQLPDPPAEGRLNAVIAHSRARHTRGRAAVEEMSGRAGRRRDGTIFLACPWPTTTRRRLYVCAHEVAHIHLHYTPSGKRIRKPST